MIQRVTQGSVSVEDTVVGSVGHGLVVFLGVALGDTEEDAAYLVEKTVTLRIFSDEYDRFNLSALETGAQVLLVSQFTLHADTRKGRRPSFARAAQPQDAEPLFERALALFRQKGLKVATGQFQKHMMVQMVNDGPVTLLLDSEDRKRPRGG